MTFRIAYLLRRSLELTVLVSLLVGTPGYAALTTDEIMTKLSPAEIEARLPEEHPSMYYLYSARLLREGDSAGALRWFYIGQLRYRIFLQSHPGEDKTAFGGLNASMGPALNHYGALHTDQWLAAIDAALAWDESHVNPLTDKDKFAAIYAEQRAGLVKLKSSVVSNADQLRESANGREPMPKDWPALVAIARAKDLEGVYGKWNLGSVTGIFFKNLPPGTKLIQATELELSALTDTRLLAIARGKNGELAREEIRVSFLDGAASFPLSDTTGKNPRGGGSKGTAYLRLNSAKDLVVEREVVLESYGESGGSHSTNHINSGRGRL